jgi:hypothetical protein
MCSLILPDVNLKFLLKAVLEDFIILGICGNLTTTIFEKREKDGLFALNKENSQKPVKNLKLPLKLIFLNFVCFYA